MGAPALHAYFRKIRASALLHLHQSRIRFEQWRHFHGLKLATFLLLAVAASAVVVLPPLQRLAGGYFCIPENLATLKSLLGGTGSALIGSATIAFSLVVFAMQINVERMPHGLFRQLSSDRRLLFSFLGSFLVALLIAGASLLPSGTWAVPAILGQCGVSRPLCCFSSMPIAVLFRSSIRSSSFQLCRASLAVTFRSGATCQNWLRLPLGKPPTRC